MWHPSCTPHTRLAPPHLAGRSVACTEMRERVHSPASVASFLRWRFPHTHTAPPHMHSTQAQHVWACLPNPWVGLHVGGGGPTQLLRGPASNASLRDLMRDLMRDLQAETENLYGNWMRTVSLGGLTLGWAPWVCAISRGRHAHAPSDKGPRGEKAVRDDSLCEMLVIATCVEFLNLCRMSEPRLGVQHPSLLSRVGICGSLSLSCGRRLATH